MADPIIPTRVIPAAELPPRPLAAGEAPPWRTPPMTPAPPPPAPPAVVVEHRHVHEIVLVPAEPEPEPTRWDRVWARLRGLGQPWQLAAALVLAVAPIPRSGYSAATTWVYVVGQVRADHGPGWGYALGLGALIWAGALMARRPGVLRLWLLAVTFVGMFGAVSLFDPITWITGVSR